MLQSVLVENVLKYYKHISITFKKGMFCYSKRLNCGTYYPGSIENYNIDNVVMIALAQGDLQSVRHHSDVSYIIVVSVMLN